MGQSKTSTTGQQQYSKYQYPTMTSAAGATGAADTEEGRRTTWRAVSHWKCLQVARPCTNKLQCKWKRLRVNMLVGAHLSSTDTKSRDGCWRKAVWTCCLVTQKLHGFSKEPLALWEMFAVMKTADLTSNVKHEVKPEEKTGGRGKSKWTEYIKNEGRL